MTRWESGIVSNQHDTGQKRQDTPEGSRCHSEEERRYQEDNRPDSVHLPSSWEVTPWGGEEGARQVNSGLQDGFHQTCHLHQLSLSLRLVLAQRWAPLTQLGPCLIVRADEGLAGCRCPHFG